MGVGRELAYGNRRSSRKRAAEVWEKTATYVRPGRAIVIPVRLARMAQGSRINPVGVLQLTAKGRGGQSAIRCTEANRKGRGAVKETTHGDQVRECHLGDVMVQID